MAGGGIDFSTLTDPVSEAEPCGPDLDLAGDPDFLQLIARTEGLLPSTFFERNDQGELQVVKVEIDFKNEFKAFDRFLEQTRDVRLLAIYGRMLALQRDLPGFSACVSSVAALLVERWSDVHPQADEGEFLLRIAILQTLDDMVTVILPLQHTPLVANRRLGGISYRTIMIANGEAEARVGEAAPDKAELERALAETDLTEIRKARDTVGSISAAAAAINTQTISQAGFEQSVSLDRLTGLASKMLAALDAVLIARDPDAGLSPPDLTQHVDTGGQVAVGTVAARPSPAGAVRSFRDVAAALFAAGGYLDRSEPSSPAAPLVRQAEQLVGKSFLEVMRVLIPDRAEEAKVAIGPDRAFVLTFQQLAAVSTPVDAGWSSGDASELETDVVPTAESAPTMEANTRSEAVTLLRQVSSFYRSAEPSSPIPYLLDRACGLADRDFLAILKDVFPES